MDLFENLQIMNEDYADPKEALQNKSNKFSELIDALGETMNEPDLNEFLRTLSDDFYLDIYDEGMPYPADLDGYFGEPVENLNLNNEEDAKLFEIVDNLLTNCITKTREFIKTQVSNLKDEISKLENTINKLQTL